MASIQREPQIRRDELVELYSSVGWSANTDDPDRLATGVGNSSIVMLSCGPVTHTLPREQGTWVRPHSCRKSPIFYLQDILVRPEHQRRGIGRRQLTACLERYRHVRQKVLLTDDDDAQRRFCERFGYRRRGDLDAPINASVRFDN